MDVSQQELFDVVEAAQSAQQDARCKLVLAPSIARALPAAPAAIQRKFYCSKHPGEKFVFTHTVMLWVQAQFDAAQVQS